MSTLSATLPNDRTSCIYQIPGDLDLASMAWLTDLQLPLSPIGLSTRKNRHQTTLKEAHSQKRRSSKRYQKPALSAACLATISIANSTTGSLSLVSLYHSISTNFPYYTYAKDDWRKELRDVLDTNAGFIRIVNVDDSGEPTWAVSPEQFCECQKAIANALQTNEARLIATMANPGSLLQTSPFRTPYEPSDGRLPLYPSPSSDCQLVNSSPSFSPSPSTTRQEPNDLGSPSHSALFPQLTSDLTGNLALSSYCTTATPIQECPRPPKTSPFGQGSPLTPQSDKLFST